MNQCQVLFITYVHLCLGVVFMGGLWAREATWPAFGGGLLLGKIEVKEV